MTFLTDSFHFLVFFYDSYSKFLFVFDNGLRDSTFFLLISFFLPLVNAFILLLFARRIGYYGLKKLTLLNFFFSWVFLTLAIFFLSTSVSPVSITVTFWDWFLSRFFSLNFSLIFDSLSLSMMWVVITISSVVHVFSLDYMRQDPHIHRFIFYLNFFTFFMLLFILANNFLLMFLGWEGIGIFSYLLITFWYTRIQANKAALKALLVNRVGDICLLLSFAIFFKLFRTLNYCEIFVILDTLSPIELEDLLLIKREFSLAVFFLILGAFGKSAQIGFHVWLPDAMEGPTPVSALLHAATMVTAGIFLLIRVSPFFFFTPEWQSLIVVIGLATIFLASTTAIFQYDIKKIIAYSTCSHLGYMFVACGFFQYHVAFFHLFNHAFFKALLFLAAGSVIHALKDEQDIRKMGGLFDRLPLTFFFFLVASFAAVGFPYLSGFYSKDLIIEIGLIQLTFESSSLRLLLILSASLSAIYTFRLLNYVFFTNYRGPSSIVSQIGDSVWWVQLSLFGLACLSVLSGFFFNDYFVGLGSILFQNYSFSDVYGLPWGLTHISEAETLGVSIRLFMFFITLLGIFGAFILDFYIFKTLWLSSTGDVKDVKFIRIIRFFSQAWFFNFYYNRIGTAFMKSVWVFYAVFDKGLLELLGPSGAYTFLMWGSQKLSALLQTGSVRFYYFFMISFLICLGLAVIYLTV